MEKLLIQELMDEISTLKIVAKEIQNNDYKMQIFYKLNEMQTLLETLLSKESD